MPRVVIADPDSTSRKALILWLIYKMGIDEIVQVANGDELKEQIEETVPDIILMDWGIPNRPSLEYCQDIQQKHPKLQWVILSVDASVSETAKCCSLWFLQKGISPATVYSFLTEVING